MKITDSKKAATAHALSHYFESLTEQFVSTPPLSRLPASKLRPDILKRLLVETYQTISCFLPDKRSYNSVFRKTFRPIITKAWQDYPTV
jgi:hypothetical protein